MLTKVTLVGPGFGLAEELIKLISEFNNSGIFFEMLTGQERRKEKSRETIDDEEKK